MNSKVLVIIPAYNESTNIVKTVQSVSDCGYDYVVINDDLKDAVDDIKTIITAETHRVSRCNKFFSEVCKNV